MVTYDITALLVVTFTVLSYSNLYGKIGRIESLTEKTKFSQTFPANTLIKNEEDEQSHTCNASSHVLYCFFILFKDELTSMHTVL